MANRSSIPAYRLHKQSGQAIVTLPDGVGGRRDILLGPYNSPQSRQDYLRRIAEWEANGRSLPQVVSPADLTVSELILRFWPHVEQHYRHADGSPTCEVNEYRRSLRPVRELYGHTLAREFGPLALKAVRERMIAAGWCRGVVNQRVGRVRRLFKWAVENELVPSAVLHGLQAVRGLARGRSAARETEPVRPVAEWVIAAVLPSLLPPVAAMLQLQLYTGMRPGEVCRMRGIDLDMTGKVWLYRPGSDRGPLGDHKTTHRGKGRVVPIGPRGQAVLKPWLRLQVEEPLFQPREAMAAYRAGLRQRRRTKVQPSQLRRRVRRQPRKAPGERYTPSSYAKAIANACRVAVPPGWHPPLAVGVPHFHPHQVRHTKATEIRREAGLDAARAVLGHSSPVVTEVYAELDVNQASKIMERLG